MRDGPWKLILDGRDGPKVGLYKLDEDLAESRNLAGAHPERVARMRAALTAWQKDVASSWQDK